MRIVFPRLSPPTPEALFLILGILIGVEYFLIEVLICILLMTNEDMRTDRAPVHGFICYLCMFFDKVFVQFFSQFLIGLFLFLLLSFESSLHIF
jgi:hypothetical protein